MDFVNFYLFPSSSSDVVILFDIIHSSDHVSGQSVVEEIIEVK